MVTVGRAIDKVLSQPSQPSLPSPVTCYPPRQPPTLCHDSDSCDLLRAISGSRSSHSQVESEYVWTCAHINLYTPLPAAPSKPNLLPSAVLHHPPHPPPPAS